MTEIPNEMYQLHSILERYISIHDKIFKFSFKKALPIPGIFKDINFGKHFRELDSLASSLDHLIILKSNKTGIPEVFQQYTQALLKAIKFLRDICARLDDMSKGDLKDYKWKQYKADLDQYHVIVERYRKFGSALNEYIHK